VWCNAFGFSVVVVMISQFFVLSPRGDAIVTKDFRNDLPRRTHETFFRLCKFWRDDDERTGMTSTSRGDADAASRARRGTSSASAPAAFHADGVNYLHIKASGLYFVSTTTTNVSPSLILELMHRLARVMKDYCGVLSEDALRKNSTLIYELIDETIDYGYAQTTSTEMLREHVCNEPVEVGNGMGGVLMSAKVDSTKIAAGAFKATQRVENMLKKNLGVKVNFPTKAAMNLMNAASVASGVNRVSSSATQKSVVSTTSAKTRDEIFVDIIEKVNVTINANGDLVTSEINGYIQVRNFLHGEDTKVKLALSEDLSIGGKGGGAGLGVLLDDCNFHEAANMDSFDIDRTITLRPPQGEFSLMNYRSSNDFTPPFRVVPIIDESIPYKVGVELKLCADFPAKHTCTGMVVTFPIPKGAVGATGRLPKHVNSSSQHVLYDGAEKKMVWQLKKLIGGSEHSCSIQISLQTERIPNVRREMGPLALTFQIPTYSTSDLAVRYLQVIGAEDARPRQPGDAPPRNPHRWIRYLTKSSSYVVRI